MKYLIDVNYILQSYLIFDYVNKILLLFIYFNPKNNCYTIQQISRE